MDDAIADGESLAVFILDSNKLKADGAHWRAFLPGDDGERSVFRIDNVTRDEVVAIGLEHVANPVQRPLRGWAQFLAAVARLQPVTLMAIEPPPRHAVIKDWPPEPEKRKVIAMVLADAADTFPLSV